MGKALVEVIDEFVKARIERDGGRDALALGVECDPSEWIEGIGIGADGEQVLCGFDGGKAASWDAEGLGVWKDRYRRTHRRFELINGGGCGIAWIDGFGVSDQGKTEDAAVVLEGLLKVAKVQPDIVGVKVAVTLDILEGVFVFRRALGGFAQEQVSVAVEREVSAFAIYGSAICDLHQKRKVVFCEVSEDREVDTCAEIVCVGDKGVADIGLKERIKESTGDQRKVDIAVTGGTPRQVVVGVLCGRQIVLADLGDAVL